MVDLRSSTANMA